MQGTPLTRLFAAAGAVLLLGAPASAFAEQIALVAESAVEHTAETGAEVALDLGTAVPDDLTTPTDYANGMLHFRAEVTAKPDATATGYRLCLLQDTARACSDPLSFEGTGTFEHSQDVSLLEGFGDLTWSLPLSGAALVATDAAGAAIASADAATYFPLSATIEAVLVDAGGTFAGYPSDQTPTNPDAGLRGRYYDNTDFTGLVDTRNDAPIDFEWTGDNPPFAELGGDWSILWTGQIEPQYSGTFTFCTVSDDGVRLWIADQLVVDDWRSHGPEEHCGDVSGLQEGQPVDVWLEYYNGGGGAAIQLLWESDEQVKEIIPDLYLTPETSSSGTQLTLLGGPEDDEVFEHAAEPVRLEIRRRGDIDEALTVEIQLSGEATAGADFEIATTQVELPAGELAASVELTMLDDMEIEGDETVTVTIAEGGYTLSPPSSVTFTLLDNDVDNFGITGEVRYSGAAAGPIVVQAFRDQDSAFEALTDTLAEAGPFQLDGGLEGLYTVVAFIDADDNGRLGADERWNAHRDEAGEIAKLTLPPSASGIVIDLDQEPPEPDAPAAGGEAGEDEGCGCMSSGSATPPVGVLLLLAVGMMLLRRRRSSPVPSEI